ncbi:MAG: hypothetical protein BGN93_19680 [Acinetobacter sp. 39-4]|nr:MAG: hypothetical protein BGN93_19680 [Acinetobacter sp. 39-4]
MSLYLLTGLVFVAVIYIALMVKDIFSLLNQTNEARYKQIKKLEDEVIKLKNDVYRLNNKLND